MALQRQVQGLQTTRKSVWQARKRELFIGAESCFTFQMRVIHRMDFLPADD
jgi:hypothetical protein